MIDTTLVAAPPAAGALAATAVAIHDAFGRRRRHRERDRHRRDGTGPYAPTARVPRVDLNAAIADHARIVFRPMVDLGRAVNAVHTAYRDHGLRVASTLARAIDAAQKTDHALSHTTRGDHR